MKTIRPIIVGCLTLLLSGPSRTRAQDELRSLEHPDWVSAVSFDAGSRLLITSCADGVLRTWADPGKLVIEGKKPVIHGIRRTGNSVMSAMALGPGGISIATGSHEGDVEVWGIEGYPWGWELGKLSKVDLLLGLRPDDPLFQATEEGAKEPAARFKLQPMGKLHRGAVLSAAWCPVKYEFATGSIDGTIKLWDSSLRRQHKVLRGHKSWVNSLSYMLPTSVLASGSSDGTVKIWDTESGKLQQTLDVTNTEIRSVAFLTDADRFKVGSWQTLEQRLAVGLRYGEVQVWNADKWERTSKFKAHDGDCWAVKFSPDGKTLITGGGDWGKPGEVKLWDVKTGELRATLKHSGEVLCVAVSPDGSRLAAGGGDGKVKIWGTEKLIGIAKRE